MCVRPQDGNPWLIRTPFRNRYVDVPPGAVESRVQVEGVVRMFLKMASACANNKNAQAQDTSRGLWLVD